MFRPAVIKLAFYLVAMTVYAAAQTTEGPRNFTGSNTTQIVNVNQNSSGYALKAKTPSTQTVGAIFGAATATSGFTNGVWGRSFSPKGVGVRGEAMATTGGATGVAGFSSARSGVGVFGHATINGFGVIGQIDSLDNNGAGVMAISGPSCCGVAAIFEQQASSSGEVLHAQTNFSGVVHRVLSLDNQGNLTISGQYSTTNGDFAENMPVRGSRSLYKAGDVLAIDASSNGRLTRVSQPYSTLVAGIYSTAPGVLGGAKRQGVPLAIVGIVPCNVTAANGAVHAGDLLVTSAKAGYAMKGTNRSRLVGAVVGKALEPLPKGDGTINVLVTLQ
jgi:hypothetical protein